MIVEMTGEARLIREVLEGCYAAAKDEAENLLALLHEMPQSMPVAHAALLAVGRLDGLHDALAVASGS